MADKRAVDAKIIKASFSCHLGHMTSKRLSPFYIHYINTYKYNIAYINNTGNLQGNLQL